jgi:Domain of unknown function (DUF4129)
MKGTRYSNKLAVRMPFSIALLFICTSSLCAATLTDYVARVSSAIILIEEVRGAYGTEAGHGRAEPVIAGDLALIREKLPEKESIKLDGQTIEIDNAWLHKALRDLETSSNSVSSRDAIARIAERLRAIQEHAQELQKATAALNDKDLEKGRLAEILRRPEYIQTAPEASAFQNLIDRFLSWLQKLMPKTKPIQPGRSRYASGAAQVLVVAICLAAIALLIWRYGPRLIKDRRKKKAKRESRIVLGETLEADQTAADLLAQAETLARQGNVRAAIRKAYIALLCELGDRKLISLAQHKTNRDYLNSVRDKVSLYASMRKLTNSFELHWYGFVPANESEWTEFRNTCQQALRIGPST